ncbi:MAG: PEP-CTERM sorting domain-containing protein [Phycisphaerae bacterium]
MLHKYVSVSSSLAAKAAIAAAACVAFAAAHAQASLIVYEPYNYGLAQGTTMTGVTTNAVGLTGAYTDTNVINAAPYPSVNDVTYNTASMSFGDLQTQGGSITSNPIGGKPIFSAQLSPSALSGVAGGTVYGSFVLSTNENNLGTNGSGSGYVDGMLLGTSTSDDNSSVINISPISWGQNYGQIRVGTVAAAGTGTQLAVNTPYLELFQISISNVGAVNASSWTLSASQFANFQGNLTAANLDTAGTGTASNQITEEAFASGTDSGIATALSGVTNMSLFSFGSTGTYDEIRLSNASLAEAAPVPEPATLGLVAVGGLGLLLLKRRKTV